MGMYCCCDQKILEKFYCKCEWDGWVSIVDFPDERKNKERKISNPIENGKYLVRIQKDGDRYELEMNFHKIPKIFYGSYMGPKKEVFLHWSEEEDFTHEHWESFQPYAWKTKETCVAMN